MRSLQAYSSALNLILHPPWLQKASIRLRLIGSLLWSSNMPSRDGLEFCQSIRPRHSRMFEDWQTALETLRRRIHVRPDTAADAQLQQAMRELLIETPDGYVVRGATPERLALISWRPEDMAP